MLEYDIVVVGGSAAGIPAAITARRHYPDRSVLVIRKEAKVAIPCGIPYVFGTVMSTDKNLIPDGVLSGNGIELLVDGVSSIDRDGRKVMTEKGETISYDRLVLATGSTPIKPPIPGLDKGNVFYAQKDVPYLDTILEKMQGMSSIVILGGGFIGIEFADEMKKRIPNVTVVEMQSHCLALAFDEDLCKEAEAKLIERGIDIKTNERLEEITGDDMVTGVTLSSGATIKADAVLVGIGAVPNVDLARDAGLDVDVGGIRVDKHQRTSDERIFAVGDCTSKFSFFTGKPSNMRLASIATMESRIAGANLYSNKRENKGVVGVFSTAIDTTCMAAAGLSESMAQDNGFETSIGIAESPDRHPGGMPGMHPMKVSLVFNKQNGEIIGGTVRGGPSAGELINTISACIQSKMTANDIAMFQLGTHPAVTASPIAYQLVNAAELAMRDM